MTALVNERKTPKLGQDVFPSFSTNAGVPMEATTKCFAGGMVARNANGNAAPASASNALVVIGVAEITVDNSAGAAAALSITPRQGCFQFNNSAGADAITKAHVGLPCFAADDNTVALTSNGGARPYAGTIVSVDTTGAGGVFVEIGVLTPALAMNAPIGGLALAADAAAANATAETVIGRVAMPMTAGAILYLPSAAVAANGTNFATITVGYRNGAGGALVTLGTLSTAATSPAAFVGQTFGTLTNVAIPAGAILTVSIAKSGTGVALPSASLLVIP